MPHANGQVRLDAQGKPLRIALRSLAGNIESAEVGYDASGSLHICARGSMRSSKVTQLAGTEMNPPLAESMIKQLQTQRAQIESTYHYSTASAPLALCRQVRVLTQQGRVTTFAEQLKRFSVGSKDLLMTYKGGTCLSLAEALADKIRRSYGLKAYVVSSNPANILTLWPSAKAVKDEENEQALRLLQQDTHTNVVVPYLSSGEKNFVVLQSMVDPIV